LVDKRAESKSIAGMNKAIFDEFIRLVNENIDRNSEAYQHELNRQNHLNTKDLAKDICLEVGKYSFEYYENLLRQNNKIQEMGIVNVVNQQLNSQKRNIIINIVKENRPEAIELAKLKLGIGIKELAEKITEVALKHQKD
jgi:hypothetical protein